MKKKLVFSALLILALTLVFFATACGGGGGGDVLGPQDRTVVYRGGSGTTATELSITNDATYRLKYGGVLKSEGTVSKTTENGAAVYTFTSKANPSKTFKADINNGILAFTTAIPTDDGATINKDALPKLAGGAFPITNLVFSKEQVYDRNNGDQIPLTNQLNNVNCEINCYQAVDGSYRALSDFATSTGIDGGKFAFTLNRTVASDKLSSLSSVVQDSTINSDIMVFRIQRFACGTDNENGTYTKTYDMYYTGTGPLSGNRAASMLVYADRAGEVKGANLDLTLVKGWNWVVLEDMDGDTQLEYAYSGMPGNDFHWGYR